jgi:LysB family phage lysis regulatory protein
VNAIAARLAVGTIALLALASCALYLRAQRAELVDARNRLAEATQRIADRDGTIDRLQRDTQRKAKQQAQLDRANDAIAATLTSVRQQNRRLIDENASLRAWADTLLPPDVVRMSARPALTGADDYRASMSTGGTMHPAGDGTPH